MVVDYGNWRDLTIVLLPELVLTAWSLFVLLVVAWRHETVADARRAGWLTLIGFGLTAAAVLWLWRLRPAPQAIAHMISVDAFRFAADLILLAGGALTVLLALDYLEREGLAIPEFYVLLQYAMLGMLFLAGAADLLILFLGIELLSIAAYVLTAFSRASPASAEAGFKYFLLGAFASGFLVYGIALVFGATGTTNLALIRFQLETVGLSANLFMVIGALFVLVGLGFKVAAVPFHMWAPDAYDGAPTPVTGFMAAAVKAAAFVALVRVALDGAGHEVSGWSNGVLGIAVASMVFGNLVALAQRTLKRMLAYSSVAHAGYLLAAVVPGTEQGAGAVLFYLAAYTLMTLAAFAVVIAVGREGERAVTFDDLAGLHQRRPWLAFAMAIAMLSLLGFPGTAGFIGKWYILQSVISGGHAGLATILVLTTVVSAGYYLPVIMAMYMRPQRDDSAHDATRLAPPARVALTIATVLTLSLGVWPGPALGVARDSARTIAATSVSPEPPPPGGE